MNYREYPRERWMAIYGAYVAQRVYEFYQAKIGLPGPGGMKQIIKEAEEVADLEAKIQVEIYEKELFEPELR